MTPTILLTGGTGTLGSHVTPLLRREDATLRILSRQQHAPADGVEYATGDLVENEGIESAVDGAEIILHLAGGPRGDAGATQNLLRAADSGGVRHLIYISVVAADGLPLRYYRSKYDGELAVEESGLPWTTLRAAQFHDLVLTVAQALSKLPVVPVLGGARFQPIDSREVAARLVELTFAQPAGRVPDLVGPTVYPMSDLVRSYLHARGRRRPVIPVRIPGKVGRVYRAGENLAPAGADVGRRTWEDFLAERVTPARGRSD